VAEDVRFEGPLATLVGAEDYIKGIRGLSRVISEIVIQKVFVEGQDVLTWYDCIRRWPPRYRWPTGCTLRKARSRPCG